MVALEYLELLLDKTIGQFVPVKLVQFGAVGMLGVGVHLCCSTWPECADFAFAWSQAAR
jgi:hypothetical protein